MRRQWTRIELLIVYYVAKYGAHGCLKKEGGGFLNELGICNYLNHGTESYLICKDKFKFELGFKMDDSSNAYNPSMRHKSIVWNYRNTTVSQMRMVILELLAGPEEKIIGFKDFLTIKEIDTKAVETEHKDQYKLDL
jgi:hypothetical protein